MGPCTMIEHGPNGGLKSTKSSSTNDAADGRPSVPRSNSCLAPAWLSEGGRGTCQYRAIAHGDRGLPTGPHRQLRGGATLTQPTVAGDGSRQAQHAAVGVASEHTCLGGSSAP